MMAKIILKAGAAISLVLYSASFASARIQHGHHPARHIYAHRHFIYDPAQTETARDAVPPFEAYAGASRGYDGVPGKSSDSDQARSAAGGRSERARERQLWRHARRPQPGEHDAMKICPDLTPHGTRVRAASRVVLGLMLVAVTASPVLAWHHYHHHHVMRTRLQCALSPFRGAAGIRGAALYLPLALSLRFARRLRP